MVVGHQRIDLAAGDRAARHVGQRPAQDLQADVGGDDGPDAVEGIAAQAGHRPAQAHLGVAGAQQAQRGALHGRQQRAGGQAVALERGDDALLVAGQLEVDVEVDGAVALAAEVLQPLVEGVGGAAARVAVVVG